MYNHEPKEYICPFCSIVAGIENESLYTKQDDVVYRDTQISVFIASHWWPNNKGHVIIVPNQHIENLFDLPDNVSTSIHSMERRVALALKKTYVCDGVSSRQHNEPSGDQDVWHYHLHVFPRYQGDQLYISNPLKKLSDPKERKVYAKKLREYFTSGTEK